nr:dihydrouridine synthase [uncultured bacterium]
MNFGCPVRKVTRKGGGAAIPLKPKLLENIVRAAVGGAGAIPVTIKFRMGVSDDLRTDLQTGRIAEQAGCSAVALHARTAAQLYDGEARWDAIASLKQSLTIPVLGNGDIWEAHDALRMMRHTGCDGVVVGRGCLGRPWLFRDLAAVFDGKEPPNPPNLGEVAGIMLQHARLLAQWFGEDHAVRAFRRHTTWYTKGFRGSASVRQAFMQVKTLAELEAVASKLNPELPFPPDSMRVPRGKSSGVQTVSLPEGYLDDLADATPPEDHGEAALDGG